MPTLVACLWRRVEATQPGRVPTHFGPATRLRRPESPWDQGALATSQVEMCPRTGNSGLAQGRVRRQRLRPARGPARLLPARADPGRHPAPRRGRGLRRGPAPLGGVADAGLARPLAPPRKEYEELPEVSETMVKLAM